MRDVKRVQNRLFDMAIVIEEILDRNNIPHSMINGTLLGAIRHGGFIPWDDDFDFCIFNECYPDALNCLNEELPGWLFLEDETTEPNYFHAWAHVKDLTTISECDHYVQDNFYTHHGLSIDLYRLEKVKLSDLCNRKEDEYIKYIAKRMELGMMDEAEKKLRLSKLCDMSEVFWRSKLRKQELSRISREVYSDLYITTRFYEIEDFFPLKKIKFENAEFLAPNDPDAVLTKCFGDYMTLPPEEERILHYSNVEFLE